MWTTTPLTSSLQIPFPIIQAPMADITTPAFVASACNAGALGSLGAAYLQPRELKKAIQEIREMTCRPFNVNLFVPIYSHPDSKVLKQANETLEIYRKKLGVPSYKLSKESPLPDFEKQIDVLLEEKIPVFSFTFGTPRKEIIQALKQTGTQIIGTATNLSEAVALEELQVDFIVAQGSEAGGHRGTFLGPFEESMMGLTALIPLIVQHVSLPIIAAGGIMNSRGIAAALLLGACGVQMGTAFLACPECKISPVYKQALLDTKIKPTVITSVFSGRPARVIKNKFVDEMEKKTGSIAPFPYQNLLKRDIRNAAKAKENPDFLSLYAGQGYPLISAQSIKTIFADLIVETTNLFKSLS